MTNQQPNVDVGLGLSVGFAAAGLLERIIIYPLDVIKTRQQLALPGRYENVACNAWALLLPTSAQ